MLQENIKYRLDPQATTVKIVPKDILQAVRTAQVVNLAQTGRRIRLINLRVKVAKQESMFRTSAACNVPEQNTAKVTQQVVNYAQTGG